MKTDYDIKILTKFINNNFDVKTMVKIGFFKSKDPLHIADRICTFFGYDSIYEYGKEPIRAHLSYYGDRPKHVNEKGELKEEPFITETISSWDSLY